MVGRGGGGEGGGGAMTSMRMRLVLSFCFIDLLLIVLVVISGYSLLGFPHVDHAKTSRFCNFPDKIFENDANIELKKSTKSMVFASLSQKRYQKTRTQNIGKRKHRHIVLLTKTSQNTGFPNFDQTNLPKIKDTPPRGGRRTCYLVVVVVVIVGSSSSRRSSRSSLSSRGNGSGSSGSSGSSSSSSSNSSSSSSSSGSSSATGVEVEVVVLEP